MAKKQFLEPGQKFGLLAIALSYLIWYIRPFKDCDWWNVACHVGSFGSSGIFSIILVVGIIGGLAFLFKIDKLVFGK